MPRDRDADKLRPDANEIAYRTVQAALGEVETPEPPGQGPKPPCGSETGPEGRQEGRPGAGDRPPPHNARTA
jgi:hypothetical protein